MKNNTTSARNCPFGPEGLGPVHRRTIPTGPRVTEDDGWDGRREVSWKATIGVGIILWSLLLMHGYRERHAPVIARPHGLAVLLGGGS